MLEGPIGCAGGLVVVAPGTDRAATDDVDLFVASAGPVVPPDGEPMPALRADGVVWRRHWIDGDRLVIDFVDLALVEVDRTRRTVTFDRALAPDLVEHLLFDHVLALVLAQAGHLVLHGGIISSSGRGVALVGSSGAGKSTLTAGAWLHGWDVGSDDGVVLSAHPATAEPIYATLRLTRDGADLLGIDPSTTTPVAGKLRLDGGPCPFTPAPVALAAVAVVEPSSAPEARFERLRGIDAHAELLGSTFHADYSQDRRLPAVVAALGDVVEQTAVGRLWVPRGRAGIDSAVALLHSLLDGADR